jgi:protein arginine N-methyltransferase 5
MCVSKADRTLANGISIPCSYTAYLAPLSSSKLYQESRTHGDTKGSETPYVVMLHAVNLLSGEGAGASGRCGGQVQACWEFVHPLPDLVVDPRGIATWPASPLVLLEGRRLTADRT